MAAVDEVGYPSGKLCRGMIWHRAMFSIVQGAAGAIPKRLKPAEAQLKVDSRGKRNKVPLVEKQHLWKRLS